MIFMVLGFDEDRPHARNYGDFIENLRYNLKDLGNKGISLMLYGSFVRRSDFVPGRSDIDALLVFPDNVVINKENLKKAALAFKNAQKGNNIPFQVTPCDIRTMEDGMFNSFDLDFQDYFKEEGRVVVGPDYRERFSYTNQTHPGQTALRFNLRKSRIGLLFCEYERETNYHKMAERFTNTLDAVSGGSKQVLALLDGRVRKSRFSALEELPGFFPNLDISALSKIQRLYTHLPELNDLYKEPTELIKFWEHSVDFFENLIKCYLDNRKQ